jgi:hypothetical protein
MKLTRLEIHRYRDLAPGTTLTFGPALNLVLGDNGTGRTTLLELVSTVLRADFSALMAEPFSLAWSLELPGTVLHLTVRNVPPSEAPAPVVVPRGALSLAAPPPTTELHPFIQAEVLLDAPATRLVMRADASGMACEVDGQPAYQRGMHWSVLDRTVWTLLFMVAQYLERDVKDRLKELLRRTFLLSPARFDEGLGAFERIGTLRYAMEMHGEDVFPLGLMSLPTWMPGWLRRRVEQELPTEALELPHTEFEHGFLARFVALSGFATGTLRVELLEKRSYEDGGRLGFGHFGFRFTRQDGSELTHGQLGFGQKRLLSFLYYLDVNEDFVIADELANGLHPRHVEACLGDLGERQAFLATQSPLVFEHLRVRTAAELRTSLVHCDVVREEGRERRRYSQPTPEVAARLFEAWRAGPVTLGALLRTHELW